MSIENRPSTENRPSGEKRPIHFFYDRTTGAVLGSHVYFDAVNNVYREQSPEELKHLIGAFAGRRKPEEVGVMSVSLPPARHPHGYYVDLKKDELRTRARLHVAASKAVVLGDGKDNVEITISTVDEHGKEVSFEGELRVRTSRGRLSAPGGRIKLERGKAKISLTSASETVDRVSVSAIDPTGRCASGSTRLAFE